MSLSDPATVLCITIAVTVTALTGYLVYTAFGPPSRELADPFEEHED
jgi:PsbN protein